MKKYKILKSIMLSFIFDNEQKDFMLDSRDNEWIESDGTTVWFVQDNDEKFKSTTTANVIDLYLRDGLIEKIGE